MDEVKGVKREREAILGWLRELLSTSDGITVHIVVEERGDSKSSVQITLDDVPGPLAGLGIRPLAQ